MRKDKRFTKKIVVVGNCQARPIAKILEALNPKIEVTATAIVHLLKQRQFEEYKEYFQEADLIVSQLVNDAYPCKFVRTNFLKAHYGTKVISIVNLFYSGYTPDWFYIRIPGEGPLRGPMGDYHNRTIFESWQQGESEETAVQLLNDVSFNQRYRFEVQRSLKELHEREKVVDVRISDVIHSKMKRQRLFYTFNHPAMNLIESYSRRVLQYADIKRRPSLIFRKQPEMLDQFIPLVNPAINLPNGKYHQHRGVDYAYDPEKRIIIGRQKSYDSKTIVNHFYTIYNKFGEVLDLKSLR
jgi:hypothetical protein